MAGLMINGTPEEQRAAVKRALDLGINYFDESPDYGDGVSESNLGAILKELGVRPVITTKVEVRAENLDDIAGHIERSVDASLQRLQVDQVDVIQIHNGPVAQRPNLQGRAYNILALEDYLKPGGAIEGLDRIVKAGKTRYVGFICRGNDGAEVRQLIDTGRFQLINLVYTLLNPTASVSGAQVERHAGLRRRHRVRAGARRWCRRVQPAGRRDAHGPRAGRRRPAPSVAARRWRRNRAVRRSAGAGQGAGVAFRLPVAARQAHARSGRGALHPDEPGRHDGAGRLLGRPAARRGLCGI